MHHLKRIAVLADNKISPEPSKTLTGVLRYRSDHVVTVVDRDNAGRDLETVLGLGIGHGIPVVPDVKSALKHRPDALLLADEPVGVAIQPYWRQQVLAAVDAGIDVINGLHYQLSEDEDVRVAAHRTSAKIWDLRKPPRQRYHTEFSADGCPVIEFRAHRPGSRTVLAVGTDCCSGKMTTMLELEREAGVRGLDGSFVATGQIGMMISGGGVAVDGIIVDFVNSIVEEVVFTAAQEHDLVLVEGQGALNHPCYSVVTLGLLHGSRPDSMILCHELGRTAIELLPDCPLPSLNRAIEINEQAARWMWPERHCKVAGISVITGHLPDSDARVALTQLEEETGLPTTDVLRYGPARLMDAILSEPAAGKDS